MFKHKLLFKLNKKDLFIQIFLLLAIYLISLVFPYVYKYVIDNSIEFVKENLYLKLLAIVIFATVGHLIIYAVNYYHQIYCNKTSMMAMEQVLSKVLKYKTSDYEKLNKSKMMEMLNNDLGSIYSWINLKVCFPIDVIKVIILLIILFNINVTLAIVSICLTPLYFLGNIITQSQIAKIITTERVKGDALFEDMHNVVYNKASIDLNNANDFFEKKYQKSQRELLTTRNKRHIFFIFALEFPGYITTIVPFILLTIGVIFVNRGTLTIGDLIMYLQYVAMIYAPISEISTLKANLDASSASFDRLNNFLGAKETQSRELYGESKGIIEIKNAKINNEKQELLYKIDNLFVDKPGIYIVKGDNGTGKTTLFNLLTGVYDSNQIVADKFVVSNNLKDNVSYLYNPSLLFAGSVLQNISLSFDNVADERIVDLNNIFNGKPLDYMVKTNPANLSLGEQQKLFLLRTFLPDKDVIILDEPSANLDYESKLILRDYLKEIKDKKYIFLIAHENIFEEIADKIFEIKNNVLTEQK